MKQIDVYLDTIQQEGVITTSFIFLAVIVAILIGDGMKSDKAKKEAKRIYPEVQKRTKSLIEPAVKKLEVVGRGLYKKLSIPKYKALFDDMKIDIKVLNNRKSYGDGLTYFMKEATFLIAKGKNRNILIKGLLAIGFFDNEPFNLSITGDMIPYDDKKTTKVGLDINHIIDKADKEVEKILLPVVNAIIKVVTSTV